jgi:hypothetical protein
MNFIACGVLHPSNSNVRKLYEIEEIELEDES